MKNNQFQILSRWFAGMLLCVVFSSTIALGQREIELRPVGDRLSFVWGVTLYAARDFDGIPIISSDGVIVSYDPLPPSSYHHLATPFWHPESGTIFATTRIKLDTVWALKVLVKDASGYLIVYILDYRNASTKIGPVVTKDPPLTPGGEYGESYKKIAGDATYVLSTYFVYVYRDSVSSWQVDTTGLGSATINDISLDTAQYVYAATTNGVFKQNPNSNMWQQITNLPTSNFASILVDRRNNIFAANYVSYNGKGTYVSTNSGSSWTLDSAGIGKQQILQLSDDVYGNTYAIANGYYQVYRRKNNTPEWTPIEGGINAITVNPVTFNSVEGDSVLYAATSFGLYSSTDQGTTWTEDNAGNPAENFSAFAIGAGGKWFTTTDLAMYSLGPTDTAWTKVFPTMGYLGFLKIYTDGLGNIYTFGAGNSNLLQPLYKSSNGGTSWTIDTAGNSLVWGGGVFFIDEKGGQHASYDDYSSFSRLYTKPYGGSWGQDTAGFGLTSAYSYSGTSAFGSDHHGYLYASGKYFNGSTRVTGEVIRRPIDGGTWVADTVGIPSSYNYCNALVPGKNGDMYAEFPPFLLHRSNSGTWSNINVPVITGSTNNSMALSVDSSGALFAAITGHDANLVYRGLGVYFSKDTGSTWTFAGADSIGFTKLVSYGDSTYGYANGIYIFTRKAASATSIRQVGNVPMSYALFQNYPNPFNPTTVINYQLRVKSFVTLTVYDVLGRKVSTLVNEEQPGGSHSVNWDASNFSSGVYFYRLKTGNFVEAKKMVLMK